MSQPELLTRVVRVLDDLGVEHMVTGSLVSSLQGEPRATHDIDLVVALPLEAVPGLVRAFPPPDYYLDEEAARDAVLRRDMVNLLDLSSGDKVDFWLLTDDPFDRCRFARRARTSMLGVPLCVSTPEDTILAKLRWAKLSGGSAKQYGDALRVYEVQESVLDSQYLDHWAVELGVSDVLASLRADAEPLPGP